MGAVLARRRLGLLTTQGSTIFFSFFLLEKFLDILKKQLPFRIREAADPGPLEAKQFHTCTYASKEFYGSTKL